MHYSLWTSAVLQQSLHACNILSQSYLIFPGPVTLALLLLLLLLAACLLVPVDDVDLAEVAHSELQERVLAVIGHLAGRHTHRVRHSVPVVTPAVES